MDVRILVRRLPFKNIGLELGCGQDYWTAGELEKVVEHPGL